MFMVPTYHRYLTCLCSRAVLHSQESAFADSFLIPVDTLFKGYEFTTFQTHSQVVTSKNGRGGGGGQNLSFPMTT